MRPRSLLLPAFSLLASSILLSGCNTAFTPVASTGGTAMSGEVYGGQNPIVGANVYAFSSGTTAYGTASTSLIAAGGIPGYGTTAGTYGNYVTTDSAGYFEIDASTPCSVGSVTYLYAVSGNPGAGTNTAAGMLTALGDCTEGVLVDSVTSSHVHINEVATVAAAYALAGFATDATDISAPTDTDALAATGIHNAIKNAAQLYSVVPNSTGDTGNIANATTPNGNGTVPQAEIDSLANSLAACVNSSGPGSSPCSTLLGDTGGSTDTATAAIYIAHNPAANVTAIFNLGTSSPPFGTALTTAPTAFTVTISYTGGGLVKPTYSGVPCSLAIDASGNVWDANYSTSASTVSKFSPLGVPEGPTTTTGYPAGIDAYCLAIDNSGNIWTANILAGYLYEITPTGTSTATSTKVSPTNVTEPTDLAFDGSGNMFITNAKSGAYEVIKATSAGVYTAKTASGLEGLTFPDTIAVEPGTAGNIWVTNGSSKYVSYLTNALAGVSEYALPATADYTYGLAIDAGGNAWAGEQATASQNLLYKITTANTATTYNPGVNGYNGGTGYITEFDSVAVDGGNNIWSTDEDLGVVYEVSDTGTILSGTYGFPTPGTGVSGTKASQTPAEEPQSIAIDGSGNVWYNTYSVATIYEMVGAGTPTITPIVSTVVNSTIGTKP